MPRNPARYAFLQNPNPKESLLSRSESLLSTSIPIACVHVPVLPIAAHHGTRNLAERALAVHRGQGRSATILWCNDIARAKGIRVGQSLAHARGRDSTLGTLPYDLSRIQRARRWVVASLLKLSPRVSETKGARFWAEPHAYSRRWTQWGQDARSVLGKLRPVAVGVGPNATVAYAAARAVRDGVRSIDPDEARDFLDAAPLEVLEIDGEARGILGSLGVWTVGQLRQFDPASLGMRFGPAVAEARRRADGFDPRGPKSPTPTPLDRAQIDLEDPIAQLPALIFVIAPALQRLTAQVRQRDEGITAVRLTLRVAPPAERVVIEARCREPSTNARSVLELLRTHLESVHLEAPVHSLSLRITESVSHARQTESLPYGPPPSRADAREVTLARLRSRLGEDRVQQASRVELGHPMERAQWVDGETVPGEALPWRRIEPPVPVQDGFVTLHGRRRRVLRLSRVERAIRPWWRQKGQASGIELLAWAELEGPVLALLLGRFAHGRDDRWDVIACVD